jgi:hypothetical protein
MALSFIYHLFIVGLATLRNFKLQPIIFISGKESRGMARFLSG